MRDPQEIEVLKCDRFSSVQSRLLRFENENFNHYWGRKYSFPWVAWNWVINLRFVHLQQAGERKLITQFHATHGKEYFRPQYVSEDVKDTGEKENQKNHPSFLSAHTTFLCVELKRKAMNLSCGTQSMDLMFPETEGNQ